MGSIRTPAVIINFKAYAEVDGRGAVGLAKVCEAVSEETGVTVAVCPPVVSLSAVTAAVGIPVFAQNIDPFKPGSATGWATPSMVKACGAVGSLMNHSEHKIPSGTVSQLVSMCRDSDLASLVCADTVAVAKDAAAFLPDIIAVEPPELIGGDISVTTANPGIVSDTVDAVKSVSRGTMVLCGAGVKTGADVKTAVDLGADGVLLASGVVKAADPRAALLDLVRYL
jgi:triosephosphate isomerase (TIM)